MILNLLQAKDIDAAVLNPERFVKLCVYTFSQIPSDWSRRGSLKKSCFASLFFSVTMSTCPCTRHDLLNTISHTKDIEDELPRISFEHTSCANRCNEARICSLHSVAQPGYGQRMQRTTWQTCMTTAGAFSPPPEPVRLMTRLPTVSCCQARLRSSAKSLSQFRTLRDALQIQDAKCMTAGAYSVFQGSTWG